MKQLAAILLFAAATLTLCACGGNSTHATTPPALTLTAGNWLLANDSVIKTETAQGPTGVKLGGEFSASSASMIPIGNADPCFPPQKPTATPLVFTGSGSGSSANSIVLTWLGNNQTLKVTAGLNPGNTIVGTYTESGNTTGNCVADNGTVYGTLVPSINGNWNGTLPGQAGTSNTPTIEPTTVKAAFMQSSTLSTDVNNNTTFGTFPLSGTITLTNPCLTSGALSLTIDNTASYIVGDTIDLSSKPATDGTVFSLRNVLLTDPTAATAMTIGTFSLTGGLCNFTDSTQAGGTQITLAKSS